MAASRIKGITIEIGGDTTQLTKALQGVNKDLKTTQSSLRDVNKLLKLDPGNTELLTQKQKLLKNSIDDTKSKLQQLKDAQSQVGQGTKEWDALQREIAATEQDLKKLEGEYKNFGSVAAQQVKAAGEKLKTLGDGMVDVGKKLTTYVTLPLAALGTAGVKSFADVDKTMQLTYKTMGATAEEANVLNVAMKDAASNSVFGMEEASNATLNFARAGLDAEEAAAALAPAMNLAAGEGGNLDTVSAGLIATINGFGDSFDETTRYADVFAAACNNSALDVDSLSDAMSIAAPIFAASGKSVEDAALYMGIMANAGIDANKAANSLKTGFARLASPTKQASDAMEALGIEVFNADGTMKDSVTIQKELHDAFAGLSEQEKLAAASAIFGKNQMSSWLALIETAPEDVDALSTSIENSKGTTDEMSDAMMNGFGGSIEKLKSSLDVLMFTLGELLAKYIQPIIDKIQEVVNWFQQLDPKTQDMIVKIGLVVAALGPLLMILGSIISFIANIMIAMPALSAAFAAITGPVGIAVAAFAGLVAAGVLIYKNWDEIKAKAKQFVEDVKKSWEQLKKNLTAIMDGIKKAVTEKWNALKTGVSNTVQSMKDGVVKTIDSLKKGVTEKWNALKDGVSSMAEGIKISVTEKWNSLKTSVTETAESIKSSVAENWTNLKESVSSTVDGIKTSVTEKWNDMKTSVSTAVENIKTVATEKWESVKTSVTSTVENITSTVSSKWNDLKETVTDKWDDLKKSASETFGNIKDSITGAFGDAKDTVVDLASDIWSSVTDKFDWLWEDVSSVVEKLKNIFDFDWELPDLKLPHFDWWWEDVGGLISLPHFDVYWYKKAYDQPVMFTKPTVLQTPYGLKGFGDGGGGEVVLSEQKLRQIAGSPTYTVNVYQQPGQDARQLAELVQRELVQMQKEQEAAYA